MIDFDPIDYEKNFSKIIKHAKNHSSGFEEENILVLVHPFFIKIEYEQFKHLFEKPQVTEYFSNLNKIQKKNNCLSLVLYECPFHYSKETYHLAEKNIFNKIIFSKKGEGKPNSLHDLNYFNNKNLYFSGMFEGLCLSDAVSSILEYSKPKQVFGIRELSLCAQYREIISKSIFPDVITYLNKEYDYFDSIKMISFEDFYKKFFK